MCDVPLCRYNPTDIVERVARGKEDNKNDLLEEAQSKASGKFSKISRLKDANVGTISRSFVKGCAISLDH